MNRLVLAGILAAILTASASMAGTLAAQGGGTACPYNACGNYVDDDGDGVCDNCGTACRHAACGNYVDDDGDGVCDNCGTACRHAACGNYVDDNGDGVCDNIGAGGGCHAHHGGRSGHCHGNK